MEAKTTLKNLEAPRGSPRRIPARFYLLIADTRTSALTAFDIDDGT